MKNSETIVYLKQWLGSGSINLFGLPYSGKDTHGRELAEYFDAPLLGGGDILRNSIIPPESKALLDAGFLMPTDQYQEIVLPYLSRKEFQGRPLILSIVGRWDGEQYGVMKATEASGHPMKAVIYLNIDEETVYERFHAAQKLGDREARDDDAEHVLANRIAQFHEKTLPVIDYYRRAGLLIELNSVMPRPQVSQLILDKLQERAQES